MNLNTHFDSIQARKIKRIYFVGIKGVGMTPLAIISKEAGYEVSGSDVEEEFQTDAILRKNNIPIDAGFKEDLLAKFVHNDSTSSLVITTAAHGGLENPQVLKAIELGIPVLTHGQALGYFMRGDLLRKRGKIRGITILGSHGKTTTTAMIATFLNKAGFDPSYAVGTSEIFPLVNPGHLGKGDFFVAEGDEYVSDIKQDRTPKFFYQNPQFVILNNIDFDHPDVYKNIEEVERVIFNYLDKLDHSTTIILNGDDRIISKHIPSLKELFNVISYGAGGGCDFKITKFTESGFNSFMRISTRGMDLGEFSLSVPGYHNAKNSLSGIALLSELGVSYDKIKDVVTIFSGTKRRIEIVGNTKHGALVIDDYAHHPEEIRATLLAVKSAYPGKKIACFFQPHMLSRTKALTQDFARSFEGSNMVVFLPIFASKREEKTGESEVTSELRDSFSKIAKTATFLSLPEKATDSPFTISENTLAVVEYIGENCSDDSWVIVVMGAGDVYRVAHALVHPNYA